MERPGAWVHRVAINLANSRFRRFAAERRAHVRHGATADRYVVSDIAAAVEVRDAVAALPPRMRAAVVLRYFADMSVAETATAMGCAEGTVRSLTHKGLGALRARSTLLRSPPMPEVRDLLRSAAARPDGPLDTDRIIAASARRRTRRRQVGAGGAVVAAALVLVGIISVLPAREQAVVLEGLTSPATSTPDTPPEERVTATTADGRFEEVVANGVLIWRHVAPSGDSTDAIVAGQVGYDPECGFYLDDGSGQRIGVVWLAGTTAGATADAMNPSVQLSGGVSATVGQQIEGGGGYGLPDRLAEAGCVPGGGEVAFFNASGTVEVSGGPVPEGPEPTPDPVDQEGDIVDALVVADQPTKPNTAAASTVALARDEVELAAQWDRFQLRGPPPDLAGLADPDVTWLFTAFGESGSCPYPYGGLMLAGTTLTFDRASEEGIEQLCTADYNPRTIVVAIPTTVLPAGFVDVIPPLGSPAATIAPLGSAEPPPAGAVPVVRHPVTVDAVVGLSLEVIPAGQGLFDIVVVNESAQAVEATTNVTFDLWTGTHYEPVGALGENGPAITIGPGESTGLMSATADPGFGAGNGWYRVITPLSLSGLPWPSVQVSGTILIEDFPLPEAGVPAAILSVGPVGPDGLTYPIEVDSCGGGLTVVAEETDIVVHVVVTTTSTSLDDCTDTAEIVLGGPRGTPDLIDATTGQRLDVPAGGDPTGES